MDHFSGACQHERGAFTGAVGIRKGRFEMANGGTLFLDEVGDMSLATQAKLLRALQEKEFERVGGTITLRVDVRLVAATNRNLESMVKAGTFREDLYYRLSVFPIMLPPLRERKSDIMLLVAHFIKKLSEQHRRNAVSVSSEVADLLINYAWPGNIRELENMIERAIILCGADSEIQLTHLPAGLRNEAVMPENKADTPNTPATTLQEALDALEARMIKEAMEKAQGNMAKAAAQLNISERIIGLRMKKYDLDFRIFRNKNHHK